MHELLPYQVEDVAFMQSHSAVLNALPTGTGKQQPIDAKVLTPQGWCRIGDLVVGSYVIGSDGLPVRVRGVYRQGVRPSYRITFSDHSSVEAGPDHLWNVLCNKSKKACVLTTNQLSLRLVLRDDTLPLTSRNLRDHLYVPLLSAPVEFERKNDLPIPPYLFGQIISNAGLAHGTPQLTVNLKDWGEIFVYLKEEEAQIGAVHEYERYGCVHVVLPGILDLIRGLGLDVKSAVKRLPEVYLRSTPTERIALLQGLMDGDGTASKERNKIGYCTISYRLAQDIQELVEGLGGIASIRTYDRAVENKPTEYLVRMRLPEWVRPFRVRRKAQRYIPRSGSRPCRTVLSIEYIRDVESVCISVEAEDGLYLTEQCILTHNTIEGSSALRGHSPVLCVVLNSMKWTWTNALVTWGGFDPSEVVVYQSDEHKVDKHFFDRPGVKAYIIHWEACRPIPQTKEEKKAHTKRRYHPAILNLKNKQWSSILLDESQALCGRTSEQSTFIRKLKSVNRYALTATPYKNDYTELWPILNFLFPKVYTSYWRWVYETFVTEPGQWGGTEILDFKNKQAFIESLRPFTIRRLKSDCLPDLPEKTYCDVPLDLSPAQRKIYDEMKKKLIVEIQDNQVISAANALALMTRLRQIACGLFLVSDKQDSSKIDALKELVGQLDKPVVIFSQFRGMILKVKEVFGSSCEVIHGNVLPEERARIVKDFQAGCFPIFAATTQVGGLGLDLFRADTVFFLDKLWNPALQMQAEDRVARLGQKSHQINIISLIARNTIESYVESVLERKEGGLDLMNQLAIHGKITGKRVKEMI